VFSKCYSAEGAEFNKLSYNILLCDTLTVDLPSITDLAFNGFRDFTCQADFTITITVQIIRCEVVIANSGKTIIHNTVQLFIVLQGQLLGEFDAVVEFVNAVHWGGVFPYVAIIGYQGAEVKGLNHQSCL